MRAKFLQQANFEYYDLNQFIDQKWSNEVKNLVVQFMQNVDLLAMADMNNCMDDEINCMIDHPDRLLAKSGLTDDFILCFKKYGSSESIKEITIPAPKGKQVKWSFFWREEPAEEWGYCPTHDNMIIREMRIDFV